MKKVSWLRASSGQGTKNIFKLEISLINCINEMLKERHEIDTNHNHLHLKFSQLQADESDRKDKVSEVLLPYLR